MNLKFLCLYIFNKYAFAFALFIPVNLAYSQPLTSSPPLGYDIMVYSNEFNTPLGEELIVDHQKLGANAESDCA
ncbi:MAG: hypothetical protein JNK41_13165 [Saprospiraceae bacterium]|nr:hypothetical protein [Saprospiraceae bacterium]